MTMGVFDKLKEECNLCERCELCRSRTNVVFGDGQEDAKIMLIGEAPGENEDLSGKPFVGRAGKLLDSLLEEAGLGRETNVYIANMIKCRPPKNRNPDPVEINSCISYLKEQIATLQPDIIVCVGSVAATYFLGSDFKISKQHGVAFYRDDNLFFPILHPAALLRNPNYIPETKEDLKALIRLSEKLKEA